MGRVLRESNSTTMGDITIIYLTMNELPKSWVQYHFGVLKEAVDNLPVISISRIPMNFGINVLQTEKRSHSNIYWQMLRGAKMAKTPYIAVVEDDILYHRDHFFIKRQPLDTFAYNANRWSLFTFGEPTYSFKLRKCNGTAILPRLEAINALQERFDKMGAVIPHQLNGELGYELVERNLGVTVRKSIYVYSSAPIVQFHHTYGTPGKSRKLTERDTQDDYARMTRKRMGMIRAYDIPHWGESKKLVNKFS